MSKTTTLANLINTYHELNAAVVDVLYEEPSPLEFMRYVARNRPFVLRGTASHWKACQTWDAGYLRNTLADVKVNVAITPLGNADAVVEHDGEKIFVEPYEAQEDFGDFLDYVQKDSSTSSSEVPEKNVKYAQTQNDNLRDEYDVLFEDVPKDIPFARIALEKDADAINFWLGNERSVTALHKDNYENIYVQVRGQKHFVLLPPIEMPCVNEQELLQARYVPETADSDRLVIKINEDAGTVPVATWDPDVPNERTAAYSHLSKPLRVTLNEGDMLYLPAMWYHKVSQSSGEEGYACAVNYWYDMDFSGGFWTSNAFLRETVLAEYNVVQYPDLITGEDEAEEQSN